LCVQTLKELRKNHFIDCSNGKPVITTKTNRTW
jgi:hypothetical protein